MKVTKEMRSEGGLPLSDMADFQDEDGTGLSVRRDGNRAVVAVDSYEIFPERVRLDAEDTRALAELLLGLAEEMESRE